MESLIGFSYPGAYAEYVKVPGRIVRHNLFELPDSVPATHGAMLEPLSCVVHGIELADIRPGDNVALIGAGPIGLFHLQLARLRGAASVVVVDLSPTRLRMARELGADETIDASEEDSVDEVKEFFDGRGADVAIEAVGRPETWKQTVEMTRKGGTSLLFGGCPSGTQISFDASHVHYGELRLLGSFHHTPSSVKAAFDLIVGGRLNLDMLITGSVSLGELERALESVASGDALKMAVYPGDS
jgi:L-iditol 2-dehydrogenase